MEEGGDVDRIGLNRCVKGHVVGDTVVEGLEHLLDSVVGELIVQSTVELLKNLSILSEIAGQRRRWRLNPNFLFLKIFWTKFVK